MRAPTNPRSAGLYRRQFSDPLGAGMLGLTLTGCRPLTGAPCAMKPWRSIFPIDQTSSHAVDRFCPDALSATTETLRPHLRA